MGRGRFIIAFWIVTIGFVSSGNTAMHNPKLVAKIDALVKKIDKKSQIGPIRLFADTCHICQDLIRPVWVEFWSDSARDLTQPLSQAQVYRDDSSHAIVAHFAFASESGDWVHYITMYYRPNGTLAKIEAELNTFHGDVIVQRWRYFDEHTKVIDQKTTYYEMHSHKPITKRTPAFDDEPVTYYAKSTDLPFSSLLR